MMFGNGNMYSTLKEMRMSGTENTQLKRMERYDFTSIDTLCFAERLVSFFLYEHDIVWKPQYSVNYSTLPDKTIDKLITTITAGVTSIAFKYARDIWAKSVPLWNHVQTFALDLRPATLYSDLFDMARRTIRGGNRDVRMYTFMTVVFDLCIRASIMNQPSLIPTAALALQFAMDRMTSGKFFERVELNAYWIAHLTDLPDPYVNSELWTMEIFKGYS